MKKILVVLITILLITPLFSQDLESVLEKNSKALGLKSRKALPNLHTKGYFVMNGTEANIPFKLIQAKPNLLRVETTVFGFKAIQTYDGKTAWSLSPTQGLEAVKTDTRDMEFIAAATAIDGPFSLEQNNKYTLIYFGEDTYQDKRVEVVSWVSDEERLKYYINSKTWLIDGVRYEYKKNGGWYSMEYRIKSYMSFKGSKFPNKVSALVNGVEMLSLHIEELKTLDKLDSDKFGKPSYN
jgi:hypothetical protein